MERTRTRKITRNRELRACTECRRRKLKCDRQLPCSACVRRDESVTCIFDKKFGERRYGPRGNSEAETRLEHLEQLVQELSQARQDQTLQSEAATVSNSDQTNHDGYDPDDVYKGATHWHAMLEDIDGLRDLLTDDLDEENLVSQASSGSISAIDLLFDSKQTTSLQQVIDQVLPARQETDRLVAAYFRGKAVAAPFIHSTRFQRLYKQFWVDPMKSPSLWTSILFSVLDVSTRTLQADPAYANESAYRSDRFALASAQCLRIGQYYKPQEHGVEALLLFVQSQCFSLLDISPEIGVLMGTLIRLATTMGYHRDPATSANKYSPFEVEMRRRTWSLCMQLDTLISFQSGLPTNVQFPTWDTKPPTNLLDSDFDEYIKELPKARPDFEPTEMMFYIVKHRFVAVFEKIVRHAQSMTEESKEELTRLERDLRNIYASLPDVFRPRLMADSIIDSPSLIVTRMCVTFIYHKSLLALHRKYALRGNRNSILNTYKSASELLNDLVETYHEFRPGGQLCTERWFMGGITWHDVLFASASLCFVLCREADRNVHDFNAESIDLAQSLILLRKVTQVMQGEKMRSQDTRKVQRIVKATIDRFNDDVNGEGAALQLSPVLLEGISEVEQGAPYFGSFNDPSWLTLAQYLNLPSRDVFCDT